MKVFREARELAESVKEFALKSGADLVGIISARDFDALPPIWVGWTIQEYTKKAKDIMSDAKSIVVIGYHVWDDMLELAIRKDGKWVYPGYLPLDYLEQKMVNYLGKKGYKACAFYSGSCKRMAQLAGFGNYGKNALIVNPVFGPWIRFTPVLTNAEMVADKPFEQNLCGGCEECVKACPVGALSPYRVNDKKCMVGVHIAEKENFRPIEKLRKYEPQFTGNSHLMCVECQKACKYGRESILVRSDCCAFNVLISADH